MDMEVYYMIHLENGHIYELTSDFDIYSCDDGRITIKAGAVFLAKRGNNRMINGRVFWKCKK